MKLSEIQNFVDTKIFVILLCFMFLDWGGHGYFVFYLPLVYFFIKGGFKGNIDSNFKLLLVFGVLYSVIDYFQTGHFGYAYNILPIINFPILYLMGKYLGHFNSDKSILRIFWLNALLMALLTIISVYQSFMEEGFVMVGRSIPLIGYGGDSDGFTYTATGLYAKLMPLTLFVSLVFLQTQNLGKWFYILVAVIAFVCCLRLQSRSAIYVTGISLLLPLILGSNTNNRNKILGIILLVGTITYVLNHFSEQLEVINRFQLNNAFDNIGSESRSDLSSSLIGKLASHPLGGLKAERYAHNLWLDSARVSGWIPFFLLIIITWRWIKTTYRIYKNTNLSEHLRIMIVVITTCITIYFGVEPVLEGAPMLFEFFILFWGGITTRLTDD